MLPERSRAFAAALLAMPLLAAAVPHRASADLVLLDADGVRNVENFRQIALALHNYESAQGALPGQYLAGSGGGAVPLLSWRVALLPYLGHEALFSAFDRAKPWDDPANLPLLQQMPDVFRSPADPAGATATRYVAGTGPGTIFEGAAGVRLSSITDGTSNTLLVGEAAAGIPWTKPEDLPVGPDPTLGGTGFGSIAAGGCVPFALADGGVHFLPDDIDPATLRGLFLRSDGLPVGDWPTCEVVIVPEPAALGLVIPPALALLIRARRRSAT